MWKLLDLFQSKGLKRTIASALAVAACAADVVPAIAPYKHALETAAAFFGAVGIGHAVIASK